MSGEWNQLTCWHVCIVTSLVITQSQILLLSQSAMANVRHAISAGKTSVEEKTQEDKNTLQGVDEWRRR